MVVSNVVEFGSVGVVRILNLDEFSFVNSRGSTKNGKGGGRTVFPLLSDLLF